MVSLFFIKRHVLNILHAKDNLIVEEIGVEELKKQENEIRIPNWINTFLMFSKD